LTDLVILNGSKAGATLPLPDVPTVLGRSPEAHLQVDDPWISSMHALFERRGGDVWVIDLESRNGTFVGEERVAEARLTAGLVLRFGRTEVRVQVRASPTPPPPPAPPARQRADAARATIRSDLTFGTGLPRVAEPEAPDPAALVVRDATLLRLALQVVPGPRSPDAAAVRSALEAATRAVLNEGGVAVRLGGAGVLAVFGLTGASADDATRALRAARAARQEVRALGAGFDVRVAVDGGALLAGNLGGPDAFELAVLGEAGERVERVLAAAAGGEILAGPGVRDAGGLGAPRSVEIAGDRLEVRTDEG
jgi:FHA domain